MADEQAEAFDEDDWHPDMRPGWRYFYWHGWNVLALVWMVAGFVAAALADYVLSKWLRREQLQGATVGVAGTLVMMADIICRARDKEPQGWWRYVSSDAGGTVAILPAWLIALGLTVLGIMIGFNLM